MACEFGNAGGHSTPTSTEQISPRSGHSGHHTDGVDWHRVQTLRTISGKTHQTHSRFVLATTLGQSYEGVRSSQDRLRRDEGQFTTLDETQLFKHAFALRTQVNRESEYRSLTPVLFYLYAEPHIWPRDGEPVDPDAEDRHRQEIRDFARRVQGDEVTFVSCSYRELLSAWQESGTPKVRSHAEAVMRSFAP